MNLPYSVGKIYNRRQDIHSVYGGQRQGGISTPNGEFVFLFTGEEGAKYGYKDEFKNDAFYLTGEGQKGNMQMVRGNRAIRDHLKNKKRLLLFEVLKKGVGFVGEASLLGFHSTQLPDVEGKLREAFIFELELLPQSTLEHHTFVVKEEPDPSSVSSLWSFSRSKLRDLITHYDTSGDPKERRVRVYQRSEAVRVSVLKRARGTCEWCDKPAPFKTLQGKAYLEPHHITRLADGGPDVPESVAALCPNCHREVHHGKNGSFINNKLAAKILALEKSDIGFFSDLS